LEKFGDSELVSLCNSLYEAALTPALMMQALEQVRRAFGFEAFHQFVLDASTSIPVVEWANNRISQEDMAIYSAHYYAVDPRPQYAAKLGVGQLFSTHEFLNPATTSRSELFQDFLIPRGVAHCMGGQLVANADYVAYIGLLDPKDRGRMVAEQQQQLARLLPHLSRSVQLMLRTESLGNQLDANAQALDASGPAVLTLSARLKVLTANKRAESLLKAKQFLTLQQGLLTGANDESSKLIEAACKKVLLSGTPASLTLGTQDPREVAHLTISKLYKSHGAGVTPGAALLLHLTEPRHQRVASVRQLMDLFNTTPAEARLARALAQGADPNTYAAENSIKVSTVRSQIKALMEKTDVNRLPDLVRVVLSVAAIR
jgi:DNA-binding CsgD family transcriptional regulator